MHRMFLLSGVSSLIDCVAIESCGSIEDGLGNDLFRDRAMVLK